jgi:hypothetical protein
MEKLEARADRPCSQLERNTGEFARPQDHDVDFFSHPGPFTLAVVSCATATQSRT